MGIDNKIVGAAITQLRLRAGMTQLQLASTLNVSHQAVSKWENGAALPDIQTLLSLTQLFGITMEQLLSGEIPSEDPPLEGHAESNEPPSFSKWIRDTIPENTIDAIQTAANKAVKTVADIGGTIYTKASEAIEKVGAEIKEKVEAAAKEETEESNESQEQKRRSVFDEANGFSEPNFDEEFDPSPDFEDSIDEDFPIIDEFEDDFILDDDIPPEEPEVQAGRMTIDDLKRMAPFMSKEKLDEIANELADLESWEDLARIAPFLSKSTIENLINRFMNSENGTPINRKALLRLAPFADSQMLFKMILKNTHLLDWDTIRRLAPFLKTKMVDQLTDFLRFGKIPSGAEEEKKPKERRSAEGLQNALNGIENMVNDVVNAVSGAFSSIPKQKPAAEAPSQEPEKPQKTFSEFKDRVARAALESGNWTWLDLHLFEIGDKELLLSIAIAALEIGDPSGIAVRTATVLEPDGLSRLFDSILEHGAWETAVALRNHADEETAGKILEKASEASESDRENAYQAVEVFASKAPRALLERITEEAILKDNWVLINALTDAF